jgi:hypothetical protein
MVLELEQFVKQIKNIWKVLKCGAGEGQRRSVTLRNEAVLHTIKEKRNIPHRVKEGRLIGLVTSCIGLCVKTHY